MASHPVYDHVVSEGAQLGANAKIQWSAVLATSMLFGASAASATVLEIGPRGDVTLIDRPSLHLNADPGSATPIPVPGPAARADAGASRLSSRSRVQATVAVAARKVGVDQALVEAVARQESGLRQDAVSPRGARGVMQLMPATARGLGVDPRDLTGNVNGGAAYLRYLLDLYRGDVARALAAYNSGPKRASGSPRLQPRETRLYVNAILERLAQQVVPAPAAQSQRTMR